MDTEETEDQSTDYRDILPDGDAEMVCFDPEAQRCSHKLIVTEDGVVRIVEDRDYGTNNGVSLAIWHRRTLRFGMPQALNTSLLREGLAPDGALSVLLDRIIDGHRVCWDGNNNVGVLDEDAQEAQDELRGIFDDGGYEGRMIAQSADDWLGNNVTEKEAARDAGLDDSSDDEVISASADVIIEEAKGSDIHLDHGDVVRFLRRALGR